MEFNDQYPRQLTDRIMKNWGVEFVGADKLKERGITGEGLKIAVIDPIISHDPLMSHQVQHEALRNQNKDIHGYGIAGFIQTLLPNAQVLLLDAHRPADIPQAIKKAVRADVDVINLSMGIPAKPSEGLQDRTMEAMVDHVTGKERVSKELFKKKAKEREGYKRSTSEIIISSRFLQKSIEEADRRGVTLVAASGYSYSKPEGTFQIFPNVIIGGAMQKNFNAIKGPTDGRTDIYAPGEGIEVPSGPYRTQSMTAHSIAAPFVTIASAIATKEVGRNPSKVRQFILDHSKEVDGKKVVDFDRLTENQKSS